MGLILLLMINFKGGIGLTWGYYSPSLDSLNSWLHNNHKERELRTTSMVVGGAVRIEPAKFLAIEISGDYYKGRSPDDVRSLFLIPIDVYLTYKYVIFPVYMFSYIGGGFDLCFTEYRDSKFIGESRVTQWGLGPIVKVGLEFVPTPRFGCEISVGWRFMKIPDIGMRDPNTGNNIPLQLSGGYLRVSVERIFR